MANNCIEGNRLMLIYKYLFIEIFIYIYIYIHKFSSLVGIATRYGLAVLRSNPGGGDIFHTRPDRPWDPPRLLHIGYRVLSGGKAAGAWR